MVSISPTRRHIRPRVAAHAAPIVVRRPRTASATTCTSMPLSTTVANSPKNEPRYVIASAAPSTPPSPPGEDPVDSSPSVARARLSRTGTTRKAVVTSAASPTIARGLRRIVLNAPSKKSPRPSGRSATTPGLCTGGPSTYGG